MIVAFREHFQKIHLLVFRGGVMNVIAAELPREENKHDDLHD
jgi:hypothetical protein